MNETTKQPAPSERSGQASFAGPLGSALPRRQLEILDHTEHRAVGGYYCGGGPDMDALVAAGMMEYAGRKSFVPDPYYRITSAGRAALRAQADGAVDS